MNNSATLSSESPHELECQALLLTRLAGVAAFGIAVTVLEFWLRVPVRPVLDCYLRTTLARAASLAAIACRSRPS